MASLDLTGNQLIVAAIVSIVVGVVYCFFGYRIFRILLGVLGFIGGALAGFTFAQQAANGQTLYLVLGAAIGGIIGAVLLIFLSIVGIFLLGALMGLILAAFLIQLLQAGDILRIILLIALPLVGGILAVLLQRVVIIISTAVSGSYAIVWGGYALLAPGAQLPVDLTHPQLKAVDSSAILALVVWVVLAAAGMMVQFLWTGRKKPGPAATVPAGGSVAPPPQVQVLVQQNVPPTPGQPVQQVQPVVPAQQTPPAVPPPSPPVGKFCPQCGQPVTHGAAFCPNCGTSIAALWQ